MKSIITGLLAVMLLGSVAQAEHVHSQVQSKTNPDKKEIVQCPVTGERFDKTKAFSKLVYKGKTYYFCCEMCPDQFKHNPEKFLKPSGTQKK